ncbi:MAG: LysM peptidoglycan-binding domain-containing protein [Bacillota bacterium]
MKKIIITILTLIIILTSINTMAAEHYTVKSDDTLWTISQKTGTAIEKITDYNNINDLNNIYVGQKLTISQTNNENSSESFRYTVKTGDLLWKIAQKYDVTQEEIINLNKLKSPYYIYVGQTLLIPGEVEESKEKSSEITDYSYYTVKAGDILWNISQKYNTTVQRLVELNDIKNSYDLYVGRKLIIPLSEVQPVNSDSGNENENNENENNEDNNNNKNRNNNKYVPYSFYEIKDDDHIWNIADHFGVRTSALVKFNNIDNINDIQVGEILIVPLKESSKLTYLKRTSKRLNNYYRVLRNDTLADIAEYYNIPEEGIRAINQLSKDEEVYTGQRLLMPVNPALFKKHEIYKVKENSQYIFDIAYNYGISIKSILKANYLKNQNTKFEKGTILLVPEDEGSQATWIDYENGKPVNSWF